MEKQIKELWAPVPGYENDYEISNFGRVRRIRDLPCGVKARILKGSHMKNGYVGVYLYRNGLGKHQYIHRLVLDCFIGGGEGKIANHKDGIKGNNHIDNLEYCTYGYNNKHAYHVGLKRPPNRKLREEDVMEILRLKPLLSYKKLADKFNVHIGTIVQIFGGRTWKHAVAKFKESKSADVFMANKQSEAGGLSSGRDSSFGDSAASEHVEEQGKPARRGKRRAF